MPVSSAAPRLTLSRLALRGSLLAGVFVDAWLAFDTHATASGSADPPEVSYWLTSSLLLVRAAAQALACHDRHRYGPLVPWIAVSHLLPLVALAGGGPPTWTIFAASIGVVQLLGRWMLAR